MMYVARMVVGTGLPALCKWSGEKPGCLCCARHGASGYPTGGGGEPGGIYPHSCGPCICGLPSVQSLDAQKLDSSSQGESTSSHTPWLNLATLELYIPLAIQVSYNISLYPIQDTLCLMYLLIISHSPSLITEESIRAR